ncbi:NGP1NT-domain-containing protein [Aulographum hederae CBS 113979]|uniref:Nucleolar GTP-binding protein 2 n=1 Tax=Aulographum hederae CBS 113979 TaxID=1176131 RepID=A0A6G1HBF2_9PEZI|nr:NGP1NT-domain-containing protein [Aulographum hederae CBS 113979]
MGTGKKEKSRKERQGKTGDGMANVRVKGENFYRDAKKVKKLNILKEGKPQRNAEGTITKAASYQSREKPQARVEPNRKWFTNTRVISQEALSAFRGAVAEQSSDPYSYLLKQNKLPMSLIRDNNTKNGLKQHQAKMAIETAPFSDTFGPKAQRKRVKMGVSSLEDLAGESEKMHDSFLERQEQAKLLSGKIGEEGGEAGSAADIIATAREPIFSKGQSKRIWNELYKVIDSSDVIIHVLDARDPLGTRCRSVEKYVKEEAPHKHLVFVLNKCDLVPTSVCANWVRVLSKEFPTLAFHASITNSFGKGSLINLLRQFSSLHKDRKQVSVGFIGYPNVGKSSIINTLRAKKVCTVAPVAGETKVWQYITLMKRIYLIDCPGVVPPNPNDTPEEILLRGVVRVENVDNPEQYIPAALAKCKEKHIERTYDIRGWKDHIDFLEMMGRRSGRLLKGGEVDLDGVAKMVLNDFLRGKIPWFTPPPKPDGADDGKEMEGREGRLGEMSRKRKIGETESVGSLSRDVSILQAGGGADQVEDDDDVDDDDFEGFGDDISAPGIDDGSEVGEDGEAIGPDDDDDDDQNNDQAGNESETTKPATVMPSDHLVEDSQNDGPRKRHKQR